MKNAYFEKLLCMKINLIPCLLTGPLPCCRSATRRAPSPPSNLNLVPPTCVSWRARQPLPAVFGERGCVCDCVCASARPPSSSSPACLHLTPLPSGSVPGSVALDKVSWIFEVLRVYSRRCTSTATGQAPPPVPDVHKSPCLSEPPCTQHSPRLSLVSHVEVMCAVRRGRVRCQWCPGGRGTPGPAPQGRGETLPVTAVSPGGR